MSRLTRQFSSFAGVGAVATMAHYLTLLALVEGGVAHPAPASAAGAALGALVSYVLNYRVTFAAQSPHRKTLPRFLAIAGVAMILNFVLMHGLVAWLALPYLAAQVVVSGVVLLLTFGANRNWTFASE